MVKINKSFIKNLVKNPVGVLEPLENDEIASVIEYLDEKYYNEGESLVSDDLYDLVRTTLRKRDPKNPAVKKIGTAIDIKDGRKEKLPYFMGSMDKIKSDSSALESFRSKFAGDYIVSDKLDGNSALLYCKDGVTKLYSRGNGVEGQNISHLLDFIQGIPNLKQLTSSTSEMTIRGELIMSKADFENVSDQGANARNMVAGLVNAKRPNMQLLPLVQFVAYSLIAPEMKPSEQFAWMYDRGFRVAHNIKIDSTHQATFQKMSELLIERRERSPFEVDGIIVAHDAYHKVEHGKNPSYAFAFKNIITQDTAEVVVSNVEWNISKDGYLKPVIEFTPVKLGGATLSRTTGFNGDFIKSNVIGPGAKVIMTRSGDVIPYIVKVTKPADAGEPQMPDVEYEWSSTQKEIMVSGNHAEVDYKQVENFFTKIKIHGLSSATIRKLYDAGYDTPSAILNASAKNIGAVIGDKNGAKIASRLAEAKSDMDCIALMDASNMFGRGFGEKRLRAIADVFPQIMDPKSKFIPTKEELMEIQGVSTTTAEKFIYGLKRYRTFMQDNKIPCSDTTQQSQDDAEMSDAESNSPKPFKDAVILFTGFRDKDLAKTLTKMGATVVDSFTKKVTLLIAKDIANSSGKIEKARTSGVEVITLANFLKKLN